ncbi:hypothetical protein F5Y07DRAFT_59876 [Xylaria sp. FL0933]|nr:hypothetical protein F5Y07DRAFT_59876 [Xylaria sp. FL0933]
MSDKQPKLSKSQHNPHRRSHHSRPASRPAKSPHSRRGRSRSRPARRARSTSVRLQPRTITPSRIHSQSRSRPRRQVNRRDIPFYIASNGQHGHSIPTVIADALRKQDQEQNEALTSTNLGYRPPTPPPEVNAQGNAMTAAPSGPGLKRRPSSSPAAANARRRRRRPRRPRQRSVPSEQDEPIPPPRPQPAPLYPPRPVSPPYSFFGIIRAKAEKDNQAREAKKKREKREQRKLRKGTQGKQLDVDKGADSPKRAKGPGTKASSNTPSKRSNSAPPLSRSPVQEAQYPDQPYDDQTRTGSQRGQPQRQKQGKQRHKKHRRHSREQPHRRQKRRSRYVMRDFFASLRRKLGNLFRFTSPAASAPAQSAQPRANFDNSSPTKDPFGAQYQKGESKTVGGQQSQQRRSRRRVDSTRQPLPYFMHGGRSPANSWHSRLSIPGSTRRFTTTVESAPGSRAPSPVRPTEEEDPGLAPTAGGPYPQRFSYHTSASAISIFARRFMGPFMSESSDPSTLDNNGLGQRRLSWRSHKLLTAGSKPVTPPSSRNPSPGVRGRSADRGQRVSMPGAYRSFSSSSMGLRGLYPSSNRKSRSVSPHRVLSPVTSPLSSPASSPDYGLTELFATPPEAWSPLDGSPVRMSSPDYGIQRLFASTPGSSGSNFGLRRLFSD